MNSFVSATGGLNSNSPVDCDYSSSFKPTTQVNSLAVRKGTLSPLQLQYLKSKEKISKRGQGPLPDCVWFSSQLSQKVVC